MYVAVCSDKGSPGATTTTLALASAWQVPATVVEADPYGGDVAVRMRTEAGAVLPETPTVLTLATAARTGPDSALVARYARTINEQLSIVPGHLIAEQASGVPDWEPLASSLAISRTPVFADLGRLHSASPVLPLAATADVLVVTGRADASSVIRLRERLCRLVPALAAKRGSPPRLFPVLIARDRHGQSHVEDLRRVLDETPAGPLVVGSGYIALDAGAVTRLEAGEFPGGWLARTALLRSARRTAAELAGLVEPARVPGAM